MKTLNFLIHGLGFASVQDAKISAFGFMLSAKVIKLAGITAFFATLVQTIFGFNWQFLLAYVTLILFEWISGVLASLKKGEKHESRKLGRMLFKILVYTLIIYMVNTFKNHLQFPVIFGYEVDPFNWLYWMVILIIIWQLFISVLENLDVLGYPFASKMIKIINKKFYETTGIDNGDNSTR